MTDHSIIEITDMTRSTHSTVENQNSVNMPPWAERLATRLKEECNNWTIPNTSPNAVPKQNASIFKLSDKEGVQELYKGRIVALGPYKNHISHQGLLFSETEKRNAVMRAAKKFRFDFKKACCEISSKINDVRDCYAESSFQLDDEELAEIILIDGCFIIISITVLSQGPLYPQLWKKQTDLAKEPIKNVCNSFVSKANQKAREVMVDLLMLENQIPLFVVDYLWVHCYKAMVYDGISIKDVALTCFEDLYPRGSKCRDTSQFSDCLHLLDLFHWSRMPIDRFRERATYTRPAGLYISTVTELQDSSVIFEKRKSDCFLDVNFSQRFFGTRGVISIPEIHLYGYNRPIIQNLVAFEQAYGLRGYGFTAYVECMAQLVQTEKDVSLLRSSGIIASTPMTDKEVIDFYKTIRDEVRVEEMPPDLYELYEQVKNHIAEKRPRCPNIWITISVFSVSIFVLSFLQTLYSILGYYDHTPGHK